MPTQDTPIVFAVPTRSGGATDRGAGAVRVEASARGNATDLVRLTAVPGQDVVRLQLVNGPELFLHPECARDLFDAQRSAPNRGGSADVTVPTRLAWGTPRSVTSAETGDGPLALDPSRRGSLNELGQVVLHAFEVVKDAVGSQGASLVTGPLARAADDRVKPGLHQLTARSPGPDDASVKVPGNQKLLILIHGTLANTAEAFKHLWEGPSLINSLLEEFDHHVYGFDHPTLTESPLQNALQLANELPEGAEVHFLTHSRGGLVAEALAQLAGRDLKEADLQSFAEPKYSEQRAALESLARALKERKIRVARVVRVACPARGTLLASHRLDAYLSVLKWGLELAQIPVAKELAAFILEVAKRRTRPDELAGLEAMMPDSAFIEWLHHSDKEIDGDLRVVAGDLQGDSISSWLKALMSDAFFWTDNDLIVQTRSMYGGRPRKGGSSFFLDRGGNVTHFNYFANELTAHAIVRAVNQPSPAEFQPIGGLSAGGLSSSGSRGGGPDPDAEAPRFTAKPAVILLPGTLGSHLKVDGERIWLSHRIINGLKRLTFGSASDVKPDGPIGAFYDALMRYLADSHEVIPFAYDWRKPIEEEASRLAEKVAAALVGRTEPVRIIAHSLGGLVARTMEKVAPDVWDQFINHERSRLLLLGTPNGGSWAPMQVLSGDNLAGNLLAHVGALFDDSGARSLFAGLPGFLQLQAGLLDPSLKLNLRETWQKLADNDRLQWQVHTPWHSLTIQGRVADWGIPSQKVLDQALELQQWLAGQDLRKHGNRVVMVVGKASQTPSGFETSDLPQRFDYLQTDRGDGTVTLANALLPGVRAFQVDVEHSQLPRPSALYAGYLNLLEQGEPKSFEFTSLLAMGMRGGQLALGVSGSGKAARSVRLRGWTDDALEAVEGSLTLPEGEQRPTSTASSPKVRLAVVNGDLTFVKEPLMLGHYRSLALTGAERVVDRFLGGTMSEALRLGRYPTRPGESQVFSNQQLNPEDPRAVPRPSAVVVVGLGAEGELGAERLTATVRQGVIGYAQHLAENPSNTSSFELATTLVASGGLGISVATSARAVAQGVRAANEKLMKEGWPIVAKLHFIELFEDRATEALRSLIAAAERQPAAFEVDSVLRTGTAPLPRPETSSYRGADYDIVSALDGPKDGPHSSIAFTIDTRRARTEVRSSTTQLPLLEALIRDAETERRPDATLGKTLFRVLVPAELDSFFGSSEAVMLEVDDATAGIPWELLTVDDDDDQPSDMPWSIRAKLVRKLQTKDFRENPSSVGGEAAVLVFGDPLCDRSTYPSLEGAQREARAVAKVLGGQAPHVGANARVMVNALLAQPYAIVHIAGHGKSDGSGVVMSGDQVLGADLVRSMRRVPDLVFVNCCHSARQGVGGLPGRAATLASALIRIGVRCVVATGWAVDDDAAEHFAQTFYEKLLAGQTFMHASSAARESTWRDFPQSNTWAAYQCYGDPDWVLNRAGGTTSASPTAGSTRAFEPRRAPIVSSAGLLVALKTLATQRGPDSKKRLERLEADFEPSFGELGEVAEAFAAAYSDLGDQTHAIRWYERAVRTEKGATFKTLEQLCNLTIRRAAERVEGAYRAWETSHDETAFSEAVKGVEESVQKCDADLKRLAGLHVTYERSNLLASAWKRRAMIAHAIFVVSKSTDKTLVERDQALFEEALRQCMDSYGKAAVLAKARKQNNVGYALLNEMTAGLVLEWVTGQPRLAAPDVQPVRDSLYAWAEAEPNFWPFAQLIELQIYEALRKGQLAAALPGVEARLEELWGRMANPREWASVRDQARFTLRPYTEGARSADEKGAAEGVTRLLERYATPEPKA